MRVVKVKGIGEPAAKEDGLRVLAERVEPGAASAVDLALPELAPSPGLAKWFGGDAAKWQEFRHRYQFELQGNPNVRRLAEAAQKGDVTLLTASPRPDQSPAEVLRAILRGR